MLRASKKHKRVRAVKSKPKALRHFKVDPVFKIDATSHKILNLCDLLNLWKLCWISWFYFNLKGYGRSDSYASKGEINLSINQPINQLIVFLVAC